MIEDRPKILQEAKMTANKDDDDLKKNLE